MRYITERIERIKAGSLKMTGMDEEDFFRECKILLSDSKTHLDMSKALNPYGEGYASYRIADII